MKDIRHSALDIRKLETLPRFAGREDAAYKPGLARMRALLARMGNPQEAFWSIHVAGTNGKGSTASMIAAIAAAAGQRTGLHTSPHLAHVTERMRVDGRPAPAAWLEAATERFWPAIEAVQPSFFEATVALSFLYFAEEAVDVAVVEVGLGGRLDATNVLAPALAVITRIGRDHAEILGDTLAAIAREKAGIIKPSVPVVVGPQEPEAADAIRAVAASQNAPLHFSRDKVRVLEAVTDFTGSTLSVETPRRRYDDLRIGLPGAHQQENAALALRAAELALDAAPDAIRAGLRDVREKAGLRGRGEVLHKRPLVVADVAHNPEGLAAALATLRPALAEGGGRLTVCFGAMRDKDAPAMARLLAEAGATVWPVPLESDRALSVNELQVHLHDAGAPVGEAVSAPEGVARFLREASAGDALLVTGSHQVVGPLLSSGTKDDGR